MLTRTDNRSTTDAKLRAQEIADKYIGQAGDGRVLTTTDNQPPAIAIESANRAAAALAKFCDDNPVIELLEQARAGASQATLAKSALAELETERTAAPIYAEWKSLDEKVKARNKLYKEPREVLEALLKRIDGLIWKYREAERVRKRQEAEVAQRAAEEAQRQAEQAAFARDEALSDADVGVVADVGRLIVDAQQAGRRADLSTTIADGLMVRAEKVTIRDEFGNRAYADRNPDVPTVTDLIAAVTALGPTTKILEAVISSARDWHTEHHPRWPNGITIVKQRSLEA